MTHPPHNEQFAYKSDWCDHCGANITYGRPDTGDRVWYGLVWYGMVDTGDRWLDNKFQSGENQGATGGNSGDG